MSKPIELTTDPVAHTPEYAREIARTLSECVRVLNHATHPGSGYPGVQYPSDAYEVTGSLAEAMRRMPQLLEQIGAFLSRQGQAGLLADSTGGMPAARVLNAMDDLRRAMAAAERLAVILDSVQQETAGLYVRETPDA